MSRPCPELKFKYRRILGRTGNRNYLMRKEGKPHALENYEYLMGSLKPLPAYPSRDIGRQA